MADDPVITALPDALATASEPENVETEQPVDLEELADAQVNGDEADRSHADCRRNRARARGAEVSPPESARGVSSSPARLHTEDAGTLRRPEGTGAGARAADPASPTGRT